MISSHFSTKKSKTRKFLQAVKEQVFTIQKIFAADENEI